MFFSGMSLRGNAAVAEIKGFFLYFAFIATDRPYLHCIVIILRWKGKLNICSKKSEANFAQKLKNKQLEFLL